MAEVMIPPWVLPESPETIRWLDDATQVFQPAFGRGMTQRGSMADPRWVLRRKYRGLRSDQLAAIRSCFNESRGQFNKILVTPHAPLRGSFPTTEFLSNSTFASSATGWGAYNNAANSVSVSDRVLRILAGASGSHGFVNSSSITTLTQYMPYVLRAMLSPGRVAGTSGNVRLGLTAGASESIANTSFATPGMMSAAGVPYDVSAGFAVIGTYGPTTGLIAGDYALCPYTSLAQCMLTDNGPNLLTYSDDTTQSPTWATTNITTTFGATAPDANATASRIVETGAAGGHFISHQAATVSSAVADYAFTCAVATSASRAWCFIEMKEGTGNTFATVFFNAQTGAIGTVTAGANWASIRTFKESLGNGWYAVTVVARKTNGATSISVDMGSASVDNTASYTGTLALNSLNVWGATLAQSSVPTRIVHTGITATSATAQPGSSLNVKGLPASSSGLVEIGDWYEIAGQLKQSTARLNSNAAGLGCLQFRPALGDSPADNDPVIVKEPFGRFIYSGQQKELENMFGLYGDVEMNLEEVYS